MAYKSMAIAHRVHKSRHIMAELKRLPWIAIVILGALLFIVAFANFLTPHSPTAFDLSARLKPPAWQAGGSSEFPLGTDSMGRDLMTRIFYGARVSLEVATIVTLITGIIGLSLGILAGYAGGWVDAIISRLVDSVMALPPILLALVFAVALGSSMVTVIVALSSVLWCNFTRLIRGETLAIKSKDFVLQAKVAGCSSFRIMFVHILPNVLNTVMILCTLNISIIILVEASLSFLGAGIPPPTPSWGQMVSDGMSYITTAWWISLIPGIALALTIFAFQMFGDWLRDRLDPKLRQL